MGGAIFVMDGGSLIARGSVTVAGNNVVGGIHGSSASDGSAFGAGLFLSGSGTVRFAPGSGQTEHVADVIDDEAGVVAQGYSPPGGFTPGEYELVKSGLGTLVLSADNDYSGGTILKAGTLEVAGALGRGPLTFVGRATLKIDNDALIDLFGDIFFGTEIRSFGQGDTVDLTGLRFHHRASATYNTTTGGLSVHSGSLTFGLGLQSPGGTRFVVANDGHGGTAVKLAPLHAAAIIDFPSAHDTSGHWAGDHVGDYLFVA
jgi:autotransporter-associated beta strand protein